MSNVAFPVSYIQNLVFEKKLPIESSNHSQNRFLSLLSPTTVNWDECTSEAEISACLHFFWKKLNLLILLTKNSELHETTTFFWLLTVTQVLQRPRKKKVKWSMGKPHQLFLVHVFSNDFWESARNFYVGNSFLGRIIWWGPPMLHLTFFFLGLWSTCVTVKSQKKWLFREAHCFWSTKWAN